MNKKILYLMIALFAGGALMVNCHHSVYDGPVGIVANPDPRMRAATIDMAEPTSPDGAAPDPGAEPVFNPKTSPVHGIHAQVPYSQPAKEGNNPADQRTKPSYGGPPIPNR